MHQDGCLANLGKAIWSVFLPDADLAVFRVKMFQSLSGEGTIAFFKNDMLIKDSLSKPLVPRGYINNVLRPIAIDLQLTPPFDRQPFTHLRYEMTDQGKVKVDFAYIPEWDSWPGLFMQGVSEVPEEEAKLRPRFYEVWKECRARREREPYQK